LFIYEDISDNLNCVVFAVFVRCDAFDVG